MTPKVSVLIPTYNRAHWVGNAIASVLAQDVDSEILVVDNGSLDNTWDVLREIQDREPRVQATRWMSNNGMEVYPSLLEMASGEYVNFFADDDEMLPGGLARKLAILDRMPQIGMVFSPVRCMDEAGQDQGEAPWGRIAETDVFGGTGFFDSLILSNFVPMPAATFRRALSPGGDLLRDPAFGHAKDWQFWLDLARRAELAYLCQPTVRLRLHGGQATVVEGVKGGGFIESMVNILKHWMLVADPPYIPSAKAWEAHQLNLAKALWATRPGDQAHCVEGLQRLKAIMTAQEERLEAAVPESVQPEAFLLEPDWTGARWVEAVLAYCEAFSPGEPVALILPLGLEGSPSPEDAGQAVMEIIAKTGRETFPDIVLVERPGDLLETLRRYPHVHTLPDSGPMPDEMEGPQGRRFLDAVHRLATQERA